VLIPIREKPEFEEKTFRMIAFNIPLARAGFFVNASKDLSFKMINFSDIDVNSFFLKMINYPFNIFRGAQTLSSI
jgi:hypothetical protein